MFIDRIYRINHTETWNFNAPTLVTSVSHKITAKCGILCPKTLLLTQKQLHAIHFFVPTRNVCPLAIPESCAQNMGLRLLENHSLSKSAVRDSRHFSDKSVTYFAGNSPAVRLLRNPWYWARCSQSKKRLHKVSGRLVGGLRQRHLLGSIVLQRPSNRNPAGSRQNLLSVVHL